MHRSDVIQQATTRLLLLAVCCFVVAAGCGPKADRRPVVVVYTALDRNFSEPILKEFEKRTGIKALAKYDTESTKTVGLANAIRAERNRPRCDVFWNNEIVNTISLKKESLLDQYRPRAAEDFPAAFRDPDGFWVGFAARARVLLVNTNLVPAGEMPASMRSLADPRWKGKIGMAKPLFGTTLTHAACLFATMGEENAKAFFAALKRNEAQIQSGNKTVALNVSAGRLAFGITDTDDALIEVESGKPVAIVYPDSKPGETGVLFIPNSLALIRNGPNPEAGKKLIEYLLSPEVEIALAKCPAAQIPLNPKVTQELRVRKPGEVEFMKVDFARASELLPATTEYLKGQFAGQR